MKIERGIEIPKGRTERKPNGYWIDLLQRMAVGDSVVIVIRERGCMVRAAHSLGYRITSQAINDFEVRIWRVE